VNGLNMILHEKAGGYVMANRFYGEMSE